MELPFSESELHAILVHFPIALAIAGVPLVLAVAVTAADRLALRWTSVALYLAVAAGAYAAFWSGDRARDQIPNSGYPDAVWETLETHEQLAETVWVGALISAVFLMIGSVRYSWVRVPATTIAFVASVITAVLVGTTGHFGGQLVYKYAVGTPGAAALYGVAPTPSTSNTVRPIAPPVAGHKTPDRHFFQGMQGDGIVVEPNTATLSPATGPDPAQGTAPGATAPPAGAGGEELMPIRPIDMDEARTVSYVRDIAPIMEEHCNECHDEGEAEGDLMLTSVEAMLAGGQKAGAAILPGDPDNSPLIMYIRGLLKPQMPKRRPALSDDEVHRLRMWIQAGAVDDSTADGAVAEGSAVSSSAQVAE